MRYSGTIFQAEFLCRPNRFIAQCLLNGETVTVHVKNTGRCKELLVPGAAVLLERSGNPARKTAYDLVSVWKDCRLINMDAQAPNRIAAEWIASGGLGFVPTLLRPESVCGDSRFDFYLEHDGHPAYAEVKGVTLEDGGVVRFPDAPTERGVKHLRGLTALAQSGTEAYVLFIIQMEGVEHLDPNTATHPAFAEALRQAADAGVHILAVDCTVTETEVLAREPVPVRLR